MEAFSYGGFCEVEVFVVRPELSVGQGLAFIQPKMVRTVSTGFRGGRLGFAVQAVPAAV